MVINFLSSLTIFPPLPTKIYKALKVNEHFFFSKCFFLSFFLCFLFLSLFFPFLSVWYSWLCLIQRHFPLFSVNLSPLALSQHSSKNGLRMKPMVLFSSLFFPLFCPFFYYDFFCYFFLLFLFFSFMIFSTFSLWRQFISPPPAFTPTEIFLNCH